MPAGKLVIHDADKRARPYDITQAVCAAAGLAAYG